MKQDILNHFNIKIAGGMEAFGNQLYYGWDKTFFEKIRRICLLELGARLKTKARVVLVGILK
ncbi:hypothetical protein [Aeromonas hydrophila]